jgi:serine protease inhibitor
MMASPSGPDGGFSGIDGLRDPAISDVIHETVVDVAEKGTEAAGAAAVILAGTRSMHPQGPGAHRRRSSVPIPHPR